MNILILTIGSRGDIQPFVALGARARAEGHRVTVCTASSFQGFVEAQGLIYAPMTDELIRLADSKAGREAVEGGGKLGLMKQVMPIIRQMLSDAWDATQTALPNVLIYHPKTLGGYSIAEKTRVPVFAALPLPYNTPTSAFPAPMLVQRNLGGALNRFSYRLIGAASAPYAGVVNRFRKEVLGLPPRGRFAADERRPDGSPMPVLYAYSPQVLPTPEDYPPHAHVTGYWFLDEGDDWQPPADLAHFLEAGAPPVYIGFGSMVGKDPAARARLILEALAQSGQRGLLASGWGGLTAADLPENVFMIEQAPHSWLFPRVAAVVHHGGAGTTAAGLRAGKPTLICPFFGDQPFWGARVAALGVGPQPISQKALTAEALAAAIRTMVTDAGMQGRAADLGARIRAEDGTGRAVAILEKAVGK
ncbi:MAG: glycosyltransferase family 1 protein [Chloroflexi bacterium]|nr:glycosyltransferase family 1 protein [Chloroflexota bacterium]